MFQGQSVLDTPPSRWWWDSPTTADPWPHHTPKAHFNGSANPWHAGLMCQVNPKPGQHMCEEKEISDSNWCDGLVSTYFWAVCYMWYQSNLILCKKMSVRVFPMKTVPLMSSGTPVYKSKVLLRKRSGTGKGWKIQTSISLILKGKWTEYLIPTKFKRWGITWGCVQSRIHK